jgi:DNA-binding response OmpR family regulator/HPt (histidine-containing phosphotransfer) domain-containing protein
MSSVKQTFDSAFASIREKYISHLSGAVAELNQFAVLCEFDEATAEMMAAIGRLAHKLNGSGQTLGFAEISAQAASLERLLETGVPSRGAAASGARALARACEAAIRSSAAIGDAAETKRESEAENASEKPELWAFIAFHNDPQVQRLLSDVFAGKAVIQHCSTRDQALAAIDARTASLLFVDLDNPECPNDTIVALYRKSRETNLAIVVFASQRRSAAIVNAVCDGNVDCLLKPLDTVSVYKKAFEALERERLIVVVCDDDRIVREFLKPKFEAAGFEVHLANDGEEVIALARRIRPSVIVLDRAMPKMEGLAALKILKAEATTHGIPVVMLTSKAHPHEVTEGLKSGAAAYMVKPFAPAAVVAKCLEVLGAPSSRRHL